MIKTAQQLNYRVQQLKLDRDRANNALQDHMETCIFCRTEKQTALSIGCMKGRRLIENYAEASKKLRGI